MGKPVFGEFAPLLSADIIQRAEKLGSANICDGMLGMGIPSDGCMEASIKPVNENMRIVGMAYTVETADGDNLPIHLALYSAKPDYVMVIDGKGYDRHPYFGDLMASTGKAVGLKGMIVDGYIRDKATISEMNFPVFCRGYLPRGPRKEKTGVINCDINCGRVHVTPGDLVVADYDGVAIVPRELIQMVLDKAEKKVEYECRRRKEILEYEHCRKNGLQLPDLTPSWVKEIMNN